MMKTVELSVARAWDLWRGVKRIRDDLGIDLFSHPEAVVHAARDARALSEQLDLPHLFGTSKNDAVLVTGIDMLGAMGSYVQPPDLENVPRVTDFATQASLVAMTIGGVVGMPVVHRHNHKRFPNPTAPVFDHQSAGRSTGLSNVEPLGYHSEIVGIRGDTKPSHLALYCIHGDQRVRTLALSPDRIVDALEPRLRDVLQQYRFTFAEGFVPDSGRAPIPVIDSDTDGTPLVHYGAATNPGGGDGVRPFTPDDDDAANALKYFEETIAAMRPVTVALSQGEAFIFDNRGLHARQFMPRAQASARPRHLVRCMFREGLDHPFVGTPTPVTPLLGTTSLDTSPELPAPHFGP
jgi:hypothetical protein